MLEDAPRPPPVRNESTGKKFGAVLFDDEKEPTSGWASVNGGAAKRINGFHDLPTDTVWWTNLTYENFFHTTKAWVNPWLRSGNYLVIKLKDALAEWGHDPATAPPDWATQFASVIFGRIMMLAYRLARECNPKLNLETAFSGETMRSDFAKLLPKADFPTGEAAVIMRSGQAFAEFTRTTVRGPRGAKVVMLRRPRVSHAFDVLTTPVPKGPFTFKSRSDLRALSPDRVSWVRGTEKPCLAEISVQQMEPDIAPVYGFGNSTDKTKRVARSWVAHPEFVVMSSFSDLEVKSAYVGSEYSAFNLDLPEPIRAFLSDKFTEFSWSAGVIAETIWRAATGRQEKGFSKGSSEERAGTSWRGAWLRAADKTSMFQMAMKLTEMGYPAASYGLGWVCCLVTEDQMSNLFLDALTVGLVPKLSDVPEQLFTLNQQIPWGGDKQAQMFAHLTMTRESNMLWNLDKLPLTADKEQRNVMLKKMLMARQSERI